MPPPSGRSEPAGRDNTQVYGVLGIVLAVVCCGPLGILFGYLSMREARRVGKEDTLGKVGFWLGIAITALALIGGIFAACAGWGSWQWGYGSDWNY